MVFIDNFLQGAYGHRSATQLVYLGTIVLQDKHMYTSEDDFELRNVQTYIILFFTRTFNFLVLNKFLLHQQVVLDAFEFQQAQLALGSGVD